MKMNNLLSRFLCVAMCLLLVTVSIGAYLPKAKASTLSDLKDKQEQIQENISESEEKLAKLEKEKANQEKVISELNKQLSILSDQYDNVSAQKNEVDGQIHGIESKITNLNKEIEKTTKQIDDKNKEIDDTVQLFCQRMRANYIAGDTSVLEILTNSSDVAGFLNRLELFKRVTNTDQKLVNKLNKEIEEIEGMKLELEGKKADLQGQMSNLETKQSELAVVEGSLKSTLNEIETKSASVEEKLKKLEGAADDVENELGSLSHQEAQIQAAIRKAMADATRTTRRQSGGSGSGSGSGYTPSITPTGPASSFMFPIKYGGAYLSSGFGYRSASISGNAFHGGIDIAGGGITGQPIYASRAGTALIAEHYSNSGYGHYVLLDHGDGYQTLYGHCQSVIINAGEKVAKGQCIAYVGSTGNVTGPHLHFEVRYNGEKVNPLNYVSLP